MHPVLYHRLLLVFLFGLAGLSAACSSRWADHQSTTTMNLVGRWKKTTHSACSAAYPALIEFKPNGLYAAEADPQATVHPLWDAGTFSTEARQAKLSTSYDAVVSYSITLTNGQLTFQAPDGCSISYQKL